MNIKLDSVADQALRIARKLKVDEAEAYVLSNKVLTIRIVNNAIFEVKSIHDVGVGVRVVVDKGLGFSSTSNLTKQNIENTLLAAVKAAKRVKFPFKMGFPKPAKPSDVSGLYDKKLSELELDEALELASTMTGASINYDERVRDNAGVLNVVEYSLFIENTGGLSVSDCGTSFEIGLTATAKENGIFSEGADATAGRSLAEIKPEQIGVNAAEMAVDGLKTSTLKEGVYSIIFWFEPSAIIASYLYSLTSPELAKMYYPLFINKIGEKVASEKVSFYDDQTMPGGYGSCRVDDEGNPARKVSIIERGVLKTFLYDTLSAKIEGEKVTGGACRSSIKLPVTAGMSIVPGKSYSMPPTAVALNPALAPGDAAQEEIIEETKDGVLAKKFHYTRLTNPGRGDFTSVLRMGLYNVKNGEVAGATSKSRLIDNFLNMLKNIDMVSKEQRTAGWWGDYASASILRSKARLTPII
jgi:PmbA protein